jgi:hypothetical protein
MQLGMIGLGRMGANMMRSSLNRNCGRNLQPGLPLRQPWEDKRIIFNRNRPLART